MRIFARDLQRLLLCFVARVAPKIRRRKKEKILVWVFRLLFPDPWWGPTPDNRLSFLP